MSTRKPISKKQFIIQTLRRASYRWYARTQAISHARVSRGLYKCAMCEKLIGTKDKKMDHVDPVVDPIKGYTTLDEYAERMLPDHHSGYQCLCLDCHSEKTKGENEIRKQNRVKKVSASKPKSKKKIKDQVVDLLEEFDIGMDIAKK